MVRPLSTLSTLLAGLRPKQRRGYPSGMKRTPLLFTASLLSSALCASAQTTVVPPDTPVEPVPVTEYAGWSNAYPLANAAIELVVVPDVGRIVHLSQPGRPNLLTLHEAHHGFVPALEGEPDWKNIGGEWLWPVAQSRWVGIQGSDWPPPPVLGDRPWQTSAWIGADGAARCRMTQSYAEPLEIQVRRTIALDPERPRITIEQRLARTHESSVPAALWQLLQVAAPSRVYLPVESDSIFENGIRSFFDPPAPEVMERHHDVLVLDTDAPGEFKLGSDSRRAWIAARSGGLLILLRAEAEDTEPPYPDGGCTLQVYSNRGLGYAEIETLSVERLLAVDESIENRLTIALLPLAEGATDGEAVALLKRHLGEPMAEEEE